MKFTSRLLAAQAVLSAAVLFASSSRLLAAPFEFLHVDFSGDTLGQQPIVAAPITPTPGNPITVPDGIGGYTPTEANSPPTVDNGTLIVGNATGISKGAILTTNSANGELGALYLDTGFNIAAQNIVLSFDINVLAAPSSATAQPKYLNNTLTQVGILLGMNSYASDPGAWAFRFAAAPTSSTGGVFAMRTPDNTGLISFFDYTNGDTHNIKLIADYSTGTVDAYVDNTLEMSNYAFWNAGASNVSTSEFFYHLNGETGTSNSVALDNISASVVPEPASLALLALAGLTLVRRHRRA